MADFCVFLILSLMFSGQCLEMGRTGSSVGIATDYVLDCPGSNPVYSEQARRKVVGARCSVYVAKGSESNS